MFDFVIGSLRPQVYNYDPMNDLRAALQNRFVLGFNTQDEVSVICSQLLQHVEQTPLKNLPILAGEYKAWYQSLPGRSFGW